MANRYLNHLLPLPGAVWVQDQEGGQGHRREHGTQQKILGKELALDEPKRMAGKVAIHSQACGEDKQRRHCLYKHQWLAHLMILPSIEVLSVSIHINMNLWSHA